MGFHVLENEHCVDEEEEEESAVRVQKVAFNSLDDERPLAFNDCLDWLALEQVDDFGFR